MSTLIALLLMTAVPVQAEQDICATSAELNEWLRELGIWSSSRAREIAAKGLTAAPATRRDEMFVVPADETNAPFRRPFDLEGRTLVFERQGTTAFAMTNIALEWDAELGARVSLTGDEPAAAVTLDFDFPFFDRSVRTLYVSGNNGIFFSAPRTSGVRQYGEAELAGGREPVIAPLLSTRSSRLTPTPSVYVRKEADFASITWVSGDFYSVRATLSSSGEIRFSYERVTSAPSGAAVLITSGAEGWRSQRTPVAQISDAAGDLRISVPGSIAGMLDITGVAINRIADLDLYEVRISTASPIVRTQMPYGEVLQFNVVLGNSAIRYLAYADGRSRYQMPSWGWNWDSGAARVEGNDVVLLFLQQHVGDLSALPVRVWSYRGTLTADFTDTFSVSLPASQKQIRTDFSAATEALLEGPIVEAFTTPALSVFRIWDQVKAADPTLTDSNVDGVAIYQNFYTDLVTYAGAYSTGGNAGVRGLYEGDFDAPLRGRLPALMHMNTVDYGHNRTSRGASRVVLHELGHRWLLFASLFENGTRSRTLNPVSAHPAQYVDTRAAFKVYTDGDTSVMGGGFFTDHKNGTFSTSEYGPYGYSWLDLYLMGLAAPAEVPPMFYLADSAPQLGGEYYAPPNLTFSGTRRDFTVHQVIDGTGARYPAYPETQRHFRVVFVLVTDPDREVTAEELASVHEYRGLLEKDFRIATDTRGAVTTSLTAPSGPRRRSAGK